MSRVCKPTTDKVDNRVAELSHKSVLTRVRRGWLHPLHRGVYAVGHANVPLNGRFLAAVEACGPTARLSHFSAAALWEIVAWDDRFPEVTVTGTSRTHRGIRVHRSKRTDGVTRRCGIPTTDPAQTLRDLSSMPQFKALRRATRKARSISLITPAEAASIIPDGYIPTRSELEDAVLDLITRGRLRPPDVNVPITLDGKRIIPDFRWPTHHLVIEADGAQFHDDRLARQDDAERQAIATRHPRQTLARFTAAGAPKLHHS